MGSKRSPAWPRNSAAPLYLDSPDSEHNILPPCGETIDRQTTFSDLPRNVRRYLSTSTACETDAASVGPAWELADSDRIVRLPELLAILQISRSSAYAWQKKGLLPHSIELGPRARGWKLSEIKRFIAALGKVAQ
ncbi:hypothetical protein SG18_14790 [Pandoraea apista]|nr:hypothetical protein SG18_14790 [Pandoraea apista]AKH73234.1 hypothetical protein XM39_14985 [Pandoraea apista]AKI61630.1 hypothetical protein AA956_07325 [Pandoraea apista]